MIIVKRCKLPLSKQKLLLNLFIAGCTARAAAPIVSVNRETAKLFFRKLRKRLYDYHIKNSRKLNGIVEIDECYTSSGDGGRKAAKQGRNLSGKIAIVGAVERKSKQLTLTRVFDTKESLPLAEQYPTGQSFTLEGYRFKFENTPDHGLALYIGSDMPLALEEKTEKMTLTVGEISFVLS